MTTFKAIQLLSVLEEKQLKQFKQFLSSKPEHYRPQIEDVFDKLHSIGNLPISISDIITLTGMPEARLNDLMNKLLLIIEEFCILQQMLEHAGGLDRKRFLLYFLSQHDLSGSYKFHYKKSKASLNDEPVSALENLSRYQYFKSVSIYEKVTKGRKISIQLSDYHKYLDHFYYLEKIKLICEEINRINIANSTSNLEDAISFLNTLKTVEKKSPLLSAYLQIAHILMTPGSPSTAEFDRLFQDIKQFDVINTSNSEPLTLCHYLINFGLRKVQKNDGEFRERFLSVIGFMEEKGLLLERNVISAPIFKATVSIYLKSGKPHLAEEFLSKYSSKLPKVNGAQISNFCRSLVAFYKREYVEAIQFLDWIQISEIDAYFALNVRRLKLKIWIEKELLSEKSISDERREELAKAVRNFRVFVMQVNRSKHQGVSEIQKKSLFNFSKYAREIVLFHHLPGRRKKLSLAISAEDNVTEKSWLLSLLKR